MTILDSAKRMFFTACISILMPGIAFASGTSDMGAGGFNQITNAAVSIQNFMQGPFASTVIILAIIFCGGMWFFNRQGQHAQMLGRIAIGAILIFLAPQVLSILGLEGAGI